MNIEIVRSLEGMEALAQEWNALLDCSASKVPFLRHEFLSAWWRSLGGGEWAQGELFIVTARAEDGKLIAIAPLFYTQNKDGKPALMLLGSVEIADYLDLIARPQDLESFITQLLAAIDSPEAPPWQVLDLYNLLEDSPTLPLLKSAAQTRRWTYQQEKLQHCPYIPLPEDWEIYLAGIDKKQRHEIRRKIRRAESHTEPVRWYIVQEEDRLDNEIEDFLRLMAQDAEKDRFLTDVMRSQLRAAIHAAFQAGWLQLAFLEVDGQKAAGYLNFDFDGHIWVYNSGLDYSFGSLSPGWVLLGYLLQWSIENGRRVFDFMRGDEDYKYRFGGVDRFVVRAQVTR